eukprot:Lankesteria_metandrocarpae@DN4701_c0_g1_i2.p1
MSFDQQNSGAHNSNTSPLEDLYGGSATDAHAAAVAQQRHAASASHLQGDYAHYHNIAVAGRPASESSQYAQTAAAPTAASSNMMHPASMGQHAAYSAFTRPGAMPPHGQLGIAGINPGVLSIGGAAGNLSNPISGWHSGGAPGGSTGIPVQQYLGGVGGSTATGLGRAAYGIPVTHYRGMVPGSRGVHSIDPTLSGNVPSQAVAMMQSMPPQQYRTTLSSGTGPLSANAATDGNTGEAGSVGVHTHNTASSDVAHYNRHPTTGSKMLKSSVELLGSQKPHGVDRDTTGGQRDDGSRSFHDPSDSSAHHSANPYSRNMTHASYTMEGQEHTAAHGGEAMVSTYRNGALMHQLDPGNSSAHRTPAEMAIDHHHQSAAQQSRSGSGKVSLASLMQAVGKVQVSDDAHSIGMPPPLKFASATDTPKPPPRLSGATVKLIAKLYGYISTESEDGAGEAGALVGSSSLARDSHTKGDAIARPPNGTQSSTTPHKGYSGQGIDHKSGNNSSSSFNNPRVTPDSHSSDSTESGLQITQEAAVSIAQLLEFRLRQVIQEAKRIQMHSLSRWDGELLPSDINHAMRCLRIPPLWSYSTPSAHTIQSSSRSDTGVSASSVLISVPGYAASSTPPALSLRRAPGTFGSWTSDRNGMTASRVTQQPSLAGSGRGGGQHSIAGGPNFNAGDSATPHTASSSLHTPAASVLLGKTTAPIVSTAHFTMQALKCQLPKGPVLRIHWLAVEGVMPFTSENDCATAKTVKEMERSTARAVLDRRDTAHKRHVIKRNYLNVTSDDRVFGGGNSGNPGTKSLLRKRNGSTADMGTSSMSDSGSILEIVQSNRCCHNLSREHRVFFEQIVTTLRAAIKDPISKEKSAAIVNVFESLRTDSGSSQLLPYISHFAANEMRQLLNSSTAEAKSFSTLIAFFSACVDNPSLQIVHYIHQFLHPLLLVVFDPLLLGGGGDLVSRSIGSTLREITNVRRLAAETVAHIMNRAKDLPAESIASVYDFFRQRLCHFVTPLPTLTGAVIGVRAFGGNAVKHLLLPVLPLLVATLEATEELELLAASRTKNRTSTQQLRSEIRSILVRELMGAVSDALDPSGIARCVETLPGMCEFAEMDSSLKNALMKLTILSSERHAPTIAAVIEKTRKEQRNIVEVEEDFFPDCPEKETACEFHTRREGGGESSSRKRSKLVEQVYRAAKKARKDGRTTEAEENLTSGTAMLCMAI